MYYVFGFKHKIILNEYQIGSPRYWASTSRLGSNTNIIYRNNIIVSCVVHAAAAGGFSGSGGCFRRRRWGRTLDNPSLTPHPRWILMISATLPRCATPLFFRRRKFRRYEPRTKTYPLGHPRPLFTAATAQTVSGGGLVDNIVRNIHLYRYHDNRIPYFYWSRTRCARVYSE